VLTNDLRTTRRPTNSPRNFETSMDARKHGGLNTGKIITHKCQSDQVQKSERKIRKKEKKQKSDFKTTKH
jgi:hypothetical protein